MFVLDYKKASSLSSQLKYSMEGIEGERQQIEKNISRIQSIDSHKGSLNAAVSNLETKCKRLTQNHQSLLSYKQKIDTLTEKAADTDERMAKRISTLSKAFRSEFGIKGNPLINWIILKGTAFINGNEVLLRLKEGLRKVFDFAGKLVTYFRNWYHFNGGRYVAKVLGQLVLGAIALIGVLTIGSGLLAIAAGIAAAISFVNCLVGFGMNIYAGTQHNDDPAWARRLGGIDTGSQLVRSYNFNNKLVNNFFNRVAFTIDIVDGVCSIITLGGGVHKLFNGSKHFMAYKSLAKELIDVGDVDQNMAKKGYVTLSKLKEAYGKRGTIIMDLGENLKKDWSTIKKIRESGTKFFSKGKGVKAYWTSAKNFFKSESDLSLSWKPDFKPGHSTLKLFHFSETKPIFSNVAWINKPSTLKMFKLGKTVGEWNKISKAFSITERVSGEKPNSLLNISGTYRSIIEAKETMGKFKKTLAATH